MCRQSCARTGTPAIADQTDGFAGALGYYRVMYDEGMWDKLALAVDVNNSSTDGLQEADYAQLLDDSSALSEAGLTPISTFLKLTRFLALAPSSDASHPPALHPERPKAL